MCLCVLIMVITTCLIIILWYIYIEKSPTFQVSFFWWNNGDEMMRNKSKKKQTLKWKKIQKKKNLKRVEINSEYIQSKQFNYKFWFALFSNKSANQKEKKNPYNQLINWLIDWYYRHFCWLIIIIIISDLVWLIFLI